MARGCTDVLLVCDPGDNTLAAIGHAWEARPTELPIHPGKQRPTIVLQPAGAFTVTGAIVVAPRKGGMRSVTVKEIRASRMPDLSQDISPRWPGLCGPTCAADVLFSLAENAPEVLAGHTRGPGPSADDGVSRMVTGGRERLEANSLAGRMGMPADGKGVTSDGMRQGLSKWLDEFSPDAWTVRLDWFEDEQEGRSRAEQREFFGRLAAAVDAGGGAILCLWPGTEYANAPVIPKVEELSAKESTSQRERSAPRDTSGSGSAESTAVKQDGSGRRGPVPLPEAAFPEPPPASPQQTADLPGRREETQPDVAASAAAKKIEAARKGLKRGRASQAYEQAAEAVTLLHQAAQSDPTLKPQLDEALDLCRRCEARLPQRGRLDGEKHTEFD